ncbi:MAG: hypothetical protein JW955_09875 [Sedimentisphaerales bacterium]|nr:hypothetical protein [Sedimentisphaerales bacterium]
MGQRILHNKNLFANVVLFLMAISLFADMALPGARQTNEISSSDRTLCHVIQIMGLGLMFVFVWCNYTLPRIPAILFWEVSLIGFLALSTCHVVFVSSREQLVTFTKYVYWPIGYFFFRLLADDVQRYMQKLLCLLIALSIFAVWYYVSQADLRAEIVARAWSGGSASSNVGWRLLSIFAVSLCLIVAGDKKGNIIAAIALLLVPLSLKRGAIFAEALVCISLVLASHRLGRMREFVNRNIHWIVGSVAVWSIFCISHVQWVLARFSNLAEDGGSGRSQIYSLLFDRWREADFFHWLFGFGFWSVPDYLQNAWLDGVYAHSDVFEMLHDYGAMGILSYLMIAAGLLVLCWHTWKVRDDGILIAFPVSSLFLAGGVISGNVMFRETVYLMLPLGFMAGRLEKASEAWGVMRCEPFRSDERSTGILLCDGVDVGGRA